MLTQRSQRKHNNKLHRATTRLAVVTSVLSALEYEQDSLEQSLALESLPPTEAKLCDANFAAAVLLDQQLTLDHQVEVEAGQG